MMNDRYLFRAKRTDNGEWVCGGSIIRFEDHGIESFYMPDVHEKCICTHDEHDNITGFEDCVFYKVDPTTICQFTGKGDEWEHDVFEYDGSIYEIVFDRDDLVWWADCDTDMDYIQLGEINQDEIKVIGNTTDNPELLYGGKSMLTYPERMNVKDRFSEYCHDKGIEETTENMFDWLAMMDLLNEEAIKELPEIKKEDK